MHLRSKITYWYAALIVAFSVLVVLPAPDKATLHKYHLTATSLRVIDVTLIIPEVLIWLVALFGYLKLNHYSQLIKNSAEGKQIAKISRGLFLLAVGMPITGLLSAVLSIITSHHAAFKSTAVIINNYAGLVFPLLAFLWMSGGAQGLSDVSRTRLTLRMQHLVILATLALGVVFCCLIVLDHRELRTVYHMSPQLVMLTLGLPYMYIWFLGLFSVAELQAYSLKVRGIVFRKSWNWFIGGLGSIIVLSIVLQYLSALSSWLTSLTLGWVLLLLYVLLLLLAGAFIVVAIGAHRLSKIEEA